MAMAGLVPPWLESLLSTPFFSVCPSHADAARNECNMFCLDCPGAAAFCFYCRATRHPDHRVIQIRRSSYHDVVRVAEVQKVLDIGGVQTYVINSARVMFLNERPQPRGSSSSKGGTHICEICSRTLLDPFRFCSLGCKLEGIKRNGDACFVLDPEAEEDATAGAATDRRRPGKGVSDRGSLRAEAEELRSREGVGHGTPPNNPRRRKGIPHRAPLPS